MKNFPFTLDQLIILQTIANEKSFKQAAQKLYLSQPTISLQVQKLERELNLSLFERDTQQTCFTETGELILNYGTRILELCEEIHKALLNLQKSEKFNLIVGSSQTTGTYLLPRIIGLFHERYPLINVHLEVNSTLRTSWNVANGQVDIAIVGGDIPPELNHLLEVTPYAEDELALILPTNHPLSQLKEIKSEDLYELKFIALEKSSTIRKVSDKILENNKIDISKLQVEIELNSIEAIKNAVQAGLGVAFVSVSSVTKELDLKLINVVSIKDIKIKRMLSIIANRNRYKSKAFENFRSEIWKLFPKKI